MRLASTTDRRNQCAQTLHVHLYDTFVSCTGHRLHSNWHIAHCRFLQSASSFLGGVAFDSFHKSGRHDGIVAVVTPRRANASVVLHLLLTDVTMDTLAKVSIAP
jgi:hypothetical protein